MTTEGKGPPPKDFSGAIYDSDTYNLNGKKPEAKFYSVEAFINALESRSSEQKTYTAVNFSILAEKNNGRSNVACLAENLFQNEVFQKKSLKIRLRILHDKNFSLDTAVELMTEINSLIGRGGKVDRLILRYVDGSSMKDEEFEALTKGFDISEDQGLLPKLVLRFPDDEGVGISDELSCLSKFLEFGWPISFFWVEKKVFIEKNLSWKHFKRVVDSSKQQFDVEFCTTGKDKQEVKPLVEIFSSINKQIDFGGFVNKADIVASHFDPNSARWREGSNLKIRKFRLFYGGESGVVLFGNICQVVINPDENLFVENLIKLFHDKQLMLVERFLTETFNKPTSLKKEFVERILQSMEGNNSVFSLEARYRVNGKKVRYPISAELQAEIHRNLVKKMKQWIDSGAKVQYGRLKLMVVGQGCAGKSSTVRSLLGEEFLEDIQSTVLADAGKGASFASKDVSFNRWKAKNLGRNFLQAEMGEYLHKVRQDVDVTWNDSFLIQKPQHQRTEKSALKQKVVKPSKQVEILDSLNKLLMNDTPIDSNGEEVKSNTNEDNDDARLTIWDFGGQNVFYFIHQLYITTGGIYLLVFNLQEMNTNPSEELEILKFWLESISMNAPNSAVVMVGTRKDDVDIEDLKSIDEQIFKVTTGKKIKLFPSEHYLYFPLDNSKKKSVKEFEADIKALRSRILDCFLNTKEDGKEKHIWQKEIPLSWMYFMGNIVSRFKGMISSNQLIQVAEEFSLEVERDLIPMIEFYKNAGAIIPFSKERFNKDSDLADFIVLHPDWLLKCLANFIYDPSIHKHNQKLKVEHQSKSLLAKYEETGILSETLVFDILREANCTETEIRFLLDLCQNNMIASKYEFQPKWSEFEEDKFWLIPVMNRMEDVPEEIQADAQPDECFNVFLHCENYIPLGFYERIVSSLVSMNAQSDGSTVAPLIYTSFASFAFREMDVFVTNESKMGDFRISIEKDDADESPKAIMNVLRIAEDVVEKLNSDALGKKLNVQLQIESLHNDKKIRCAWKDFTAAIATKSKKVRGCYVASKLEKNLKIAFFEPLIETALLVLKGNSIMERQQKKIKLLKNSEEGIISANSSRNRGTPELKWEFQCFLAHTWGPKNVTHLQVIEIGKRLKVRGLKIWIDDANLKEFVAHDIVRGLRKSASTICFLTKLYFKKLNDPNTNAAKEFNVASSKGLDTIIPVVLDKECLDLKNWGLSDLSYHLLGALYIDFSSEEKIEENFKRLMERIELLAQRPRIPNSFDTQM